MLRKNSLFIPEGLRNTSSVSILTGGIDMKRTLSLVLALALTAALFTGCGCEANVSTHPGGMITEEPTTRPSVMPTPTATHETTRPMETTRPHATTPSGNGTEATGENSMPTGTTGATTPTDTTMDARHRNRNSTR